MRVRLTVVISASVLALMAYGCGGDSEEPAETIAEMTDLSHTTSADITGPRVGINTFIDTALAYYERDDVEGLFMRGFAQEDKDMMEFEGSWDKNLRRYSMFKEFIVPALESAKQTEPTYNADSTVATFELDNAPLPFVFKEIDGVWYFGGRISGD